MQKLNNSEIKVTEVVSFILEQFRNEKVKHDLEVTSELILIARILHQRFKINSGFRPTLSDKFPQNGDTKN